MPSRLALLAAASPLILGVMPGAAAGATGINGGSAAAPQANYVRELTTFNASQTAYQFSAPPPATSSAVQTAVLNNDYTQLGPQVAPAVIHFGASEQPLSVTQIASWATIATGQSQAGNLIQIPSLGTGLALPIANRAITRNGQLVLDDNALCGIFSGLLTDWSQVGTVASAGPIRVVYRPESAGTTFTLTQHLAAVCTSANSIFQPLPAATTTFTTLFPNGVPRNFYPVRTLAGLAFDMARNETSAIGYLSPDYTTIAPNSDARLSDGTRSPLVVAAVRAPNGRAYLPDIAGITRGLNHPGAISFNSTPPATATAARVPSNWLPLVPTTTDGYPLVAYSNLLMPQCFSDRTVGAGLRAWLSAHYGNPAYVAIQNSNGLVRIAGTPASRFLAAVRANILSNVNGWNVNIGNAALCKAVPGRGVNGPGR